MDSKSFVQRYSAFKSTYSDRIAEIERALVRSEAFSEKDPPILGTSGLPLFYFINTEFLLGDGGEWEQYGNNSSAMISHSLRQRLNSSFNLTIELLTDAVRFFQVDKMPDGIAGLQRRDWPFSGCVAARLGLPHYSIYKDGRVQRIEFSGEEISDIIPSSLDGLRLVHISDLLNQASSALTGWIPMYREADAKCEMFLNVVTRSQGGEQAMESTNIPVVSLISVEDDFLRRHGQNPQFLLSSRLTPEKAARDYIDQHGLSSFLPLFSPNHAKHDRAKRFFQNYLTKWLDDSALEGFRAEVRNRYNYEL